MEAKGLREVLTVGYSPCPNDTFIFHGLVAGSVDLGGLLLKEQLHDVETLNQMAFERRLDVTKLSFYAYLAVKDKYRLLKSGGALGYGCGPLLVAKRRLDYRDLSACRVVVPGRWTTAHLLLQLWAPDLKDRIFTSYDRVFETLAQGRADCGVIIHESRFTYLQYGLKMIVDLGSWWEEQTGLPIALGCIAVDRKHPPQVARRLEQGIVASIRQARSDPGRVEPYIRRYAQEMDPEVLESHIQTFVNRFSLDLGPEGQAAVEALERHAVEAGVL